MDTNQEKKEDEQTTIQPWVIILICCSIASVIFVLIFYYRGSDNFQTKQDRSPRRHHSSSSSRFASSPIRFYQSDQPYYEFTNFWASPIIEPKTRHQFPTTEHYFQSHKFEFDKNMYNNIRKEPRARGAFQRANNYTKYIRTHDPRLYNKWLDWWINKNTRIDVMKRALHLKFTQHDDLRRKLLQTRNRELIEHTRNDNFWGDGGDGSGKNILGKLLMELRNNLRYSDNPKPPDFKSFRRS